MYKEYWEHKFFTSIYAVCAVLFFGLPGIALLIEEKTNTPPTVLIIFLLCTGTLFLWLAITSIRHPIYKISGDKFCYRGLLSKEFCAELDDTWTVTGGGSLFTISKGKKHFYIAQWILGRKQYMDLLERLGKMADANSNKRMQTDRPTAGR